MSRGKNNNLLRARQASGQLPSGLENNQEQVQKCRALVQVMKDTCYTPAAAMILCMARSKKPYTLREIERAWMAFLEKEEPGDFMLQRLSDVDEVYCKMLHAGRVFKGPRTNWHPDFDDLLDDLVADQNKRLIKWHELYSQYNVIILENEYNKMLVEHYQKAYPGADPQETISQINTIYQKFWKSLGAK